MPCHDLPPGSFPHRGGEIEHRVTRESLQVQRCEHAGEVPLPVPEIVFEVVSSGLQRVERLVLHLPALAQRWPSRRHYPAPTGRSVMKLLRYVTVPSALTISTLNQLTSIAFALRRNDTPPGH